MPKLNYTAENTLAQFHASDAFVRGVRGPIGSGKSTGCCFEILHRAWKQKPFNGIKKTRCAIIRNTYGELKTTTIKTWLDWFGDFTKITYNYPIQALFTPPDYEGKSKIECELIFISMDSEKAIRHLKSLELTFAWLNEAVELNPEILKMLTGRVGRYPSQREGGRAWSGVFMDTNSCSEDNWYYDLSISQKPDEYDFYEQPPALLKTDKGFFPNPEAENIPNLRASSEDDISKGYDYYFKQLPGKPIEWVNVYILNQFGSSKPESVVYDRYSKENHCTEIFNSNNPELIWTHDFNFTPLSSAIIQRKDNKIYVIDEIILNSAVARQTALEFCERYKGYKGIVKIYGDASGHIGEKHGHPSDYIEIEKILRANNFRVNMFVPRSDPAIKDGQNSLRALIVDALGERKLFVNPKKCTYTDKGLATTRLKKGSTFQEQDSEYQHITTALRYFTAVEHPVHKGKAQAVRIQ